MTEPVLSYTTTKHALTIREIERLKAEGYTVTVQISGDSDEVKVHAERKEAKNG